MITRMMWWARRTRTLDEISFWLIENNCRVLIAACDTFRAGAVEQLRIHKRHLNSLRQPEKHGGKQMVELYEKGYGKDAASIPMEAINHGWRCNINDLHHRTAHSFVGTAKKTYIDLRTINAKAVVHALMK
ncbi:signal recognition particle receptor subunit alpha-like [Dermacentor andersoni]|uniref:signal recognition particle receptor subunit alpha-like n=1 Tax=Dermacentor andersoni TaxID=34620 RepID=UPI003B3AB383